MPKKRVNAKKTTKKKSVSSGMSHKSLSEAKELSQKILDTVRESMLVLDRDLRVKAANESFYKSYEVSPEETEGQLIYDLGNGQWDIPELRQLLEGVLPDQRAFKSYEVHHEFETLGRRIMLLNGRQIDELRLILLAIDDITDYRVGEQRRTFLLELSDALRDSESPAAVLQEASKRLPQFLHCERAAYAELNRESDQMTILAQEARGVDPLPEAQRIRDFGYRGLSVIENEQPLVIDDVRQDPLTAGHAETFERNQVGAMVCVPLVRADGLPAVLAVSHRVPHPWSEEEITTIVEVADRTWAGLEAVRAFEALRESEQRFRTLFESIDEGFCVIEMLYDDIDRPVDYRFMNVNPAFEKQTGISGAVGRRIREFAPEHEEYWFEIYDEVARTGKAARFQMAAEALGRYYDVYAFRLDDPKHRRVAVLFNDITERKRTEEELRILNESLEQQVLHRTEILKILQDVTRAANEARTVEEAMLAAMRRIVQYDGWQVGHVWELADDGSGDMVSSGIWYLTEKAERAVSRLDEFRRHCEESRYSAGMGMVGSVMRSREPQWIDDITDLHDWWVGTDDSYGLHAAIAFPVTINENVVAVLEFFSDHPAKREERFLEIMPDVGIQLGHVIQRKALERQIADTAESEQRRMGSDIHDGVGQELTGLKYIASSCAESLRERSAPEADVARRVAEGLERVQKQLRAVIRDLIPVELDKEGLEAALRSLAERVRETHEIDCRVQCKQPIVMENNLLATHLYRIIQEAVNNAVRHAQPRCLLIRVREGRDGRDLQVIDDGKGIPLEVQQRGGFGLRSMSYRADLIGARLNIEAGKTGGTVVTCTIPRREGK